MAYTPTYVNYGVVTSFINDFKQAHPDLQTNSTNGRIPINKPFVLARMMDELVRLGLADNRENPLGHAKALINGRPSIMMTERRYPVEEAQELYKYGIPVPFEPSSPNNHSAQDDHSHGDPGEGGQNQGQGQGQSQDQDQEQGEGQETGAVGTVIPDPVPEPNPEPTPEPEPNPDPTPIPGPVPVPIPIPPEPEEPDEKSLLGKILKAMRYTFVKHQTGGFINLVGPAGLGKTFQVRKACKILNARIFVQTAVDTTSELVGSLRLV